MYRARGACTRDSKSIALGNIERKRRKGQLLEPPFSGLQVLGSKADLLLWSSLFLAKTGFHSSADLSQHLLGGVGISPGRLQFQILLEGLGGA